MRWHRWLLILGGASACTNPISNQLFYDDALMVAALPSEARVGPPSQLRLARVGDADLLAAAVAEAAVVDDVTEVIARSGDLLRATEPDERTDVARVWRAQRAAGDIGSQRVSWWVRGEVLRPSDDADLTWEIEMAPDQSGPWLPVGLGAHDGDGDAVGEGALQWDLGLSLEAMGLDPSDAPGLIDIRYEIDAEGERTTEMSYDDGGVNVAGPWTMVGDIALGWEGVVTLPDGSGGTVEAYGAVAVLTTVDGGWGEGELYPGAEPLVFETCWDGNGDRVYEDGDLDPTGRVSDCALEDPF